ncbi:MAG: hypothetical protein JWO71_1468 [Candidatus Acidoferrum typicum]|nr:hypothetical protein [Candidatus Acidoferrum typicum]
MKTKKSAQKQPKEIFAEILASDLDKSALTVCVASTGKAGVEPSFQKLQLSTELAEEFRSVVQSSLTKYLEKSADGDLKVYQYDAGSKADSHEIEYLDLTKHDEIGKQFAPLSSLADVLLFTAQDEFVSGLRFYVIIVQPQQGSPIYCFRSYTPKKKLRRSPLFAAIFEDGTFDRIAEPTFLFDNRIHCMAHGTFMFVFNKDSFHKIFRFFDMVLKTAEKTLESIGSRVPIDNFEEFSEACKGHYQMQAKLKNIANKPYLKNLTMDAVKKVLAELPHLGVEIIIKNGEEMLVFNPKDKWAFLRLLDDDYLKSLMTGENYEVSGKRPYEA